MADSSRAAPGGARTAGPRRATKAPRTKPAEVRRAELMAAAERLFLSQGVEATTVAQITRAAGVAKGSFYLQFTTRDELLSALRRRFLDDYLEELDAVVGEVPEDHHAARLAVWTAVTLSVFLDGAAQRGLLFAAPGDYAAPTPASPGGGNGAVERLTALLEAGARAGTWRLPAARATAVFLFHGLLGLLDDRAGVDREALEEAAMALVERLVLASD